MTFAGFLRGFGLWLSKTLFIFFMMISVSIYAGSYITGESFLKPLVQDTMASQLNTQISGISDSLIQECNTRSTETITLPLDFLQSSLDINCTKLKQDPSEVSRMLTEGVSEKAFESFYKKKVCEGSKCLDILKNLPENLQKNPLSATDLMSEDFHNYIKDKLMIALGLAALFGVLIFAFARGWSKKFRALGGSLIISGLPYFGMSLLRETLKANLPSRAYEMIMRLVNTLSTAFLCVLITGCVLWIVGFVLKFALRKKEEKIEVVKKAKPKAKAKKVIKKGKLKERK